MGADRDGGPPIREACELYLRDIRARELSAGTQSRYSALLARLRKAARREQVDLLADISPGLIRRWRETWSCAASTHGQQLAMLKAFFRFACSAGWIPESPAQGIKAPKSDSRPTEPLDVEEVRAMLRAAEGQPRERALLLLLRYSGLALRDAVTLPRKALGPDGMLVLRRAKNGVRVSVPLPNCVPAALAGVAAAQPDRDHWFWTGRSQPVTCAKYWRERLKRVAAAAGVKGFHPHRLRDTFAVELMLTGVDLEDIKTLLGHRRLETTERYYAPWNKRRNERLQLIVSGAQVQDPILLEEEIKPTGAEWPTPVEAGLTTHHVDSRPRAQAQNSTL